MKKILMDEFEINYIDNENKSERTLLFIHGNSHSCRTFRRQFQSKFFNDYRLIALDLPGHGSSDELQDYSVPKLAHVLKNFCQKLQLENLIIIGHSLGGHIALQALNEINPAGILIFGTPPLSLPMDMLGFKANPDLALIFQSDLTLEQIEIIIKNFYTKSELDRTDIEDFQRTHKAFRPMLFKSFSEGKIMDERMALNQFQGAKAIIHGIHDKLVDMSPFKDKINLNEFWQGKVIELNSSHNLHLENSEEFNKILVKFADETFNIGLVEESITMEESVYDN